MLPFTFAARLRRGQALAPGVCRTYAGPVLINKLAAIMAGLDNAPRGSNRTDCGDDIEPPCHRGPADRENGAQGEETGDDCGDLCALSPRFVLLQYLL